MAGGDYDGDTVHIINDPRLLIHFENADVTFADPPPDFDDYVQQDVEHVEAFQSRISNLSARDRRQELQAALVRSNTLPTLVGLYSSWADLSVYENGKQQCLSGELSQLTVLLA